MLARKPLLVLHFCSAPSRAEMQAVAASSYAHGTRARFHAGSWHKHGPAGSDRGFPGERIVSKHAALIAAIVVTVLLGIIRNSRVPAKGQIDVGFEGVAAVGIALRLLKVVLVVAVLSDVFLCHRVAPQTPACEIALEVFSPIGAFFILPLLLGLPQLVFCLLLLTGPAATQQRRDEQNK